jgi:eukaryotic-like serine/threonine-protein kinase
LRGRSGPVPYRTAAGLLATLAEAVDHAHQRGVLHRDLKPSNVMLEMPAGPMLESASNGSKLVPRITDFGLAKLVDAEPGAAGATQSGVIIGSPSYMAPEQAGGHAGAVGPGADIYSLGVILYEVLTGRPPFQEDSALETLVLVRTQDPLSPSRLRPRLPRDLETICLKCLRRQPHARYPTASALAEDLGRFLAAQPIRARPTPAWERAIKWVRRHPALSAVAGAACVAAVAVAAVIGIANVRLQRERDRAVANLRKAREAVDSMVTRVSEVRLKDLPQVEPVQRALLEDAREFYRGFVRQAQDDPEVLLEASQAYRRLGDRYAALGWYDEAKRCFDEALALQKKLAAAFPGVPIYRRELARSYRSLGVRLTSVGRKSDPLDDVEKSLALLDELVAADPREPGYRVDRAATIESRGLLLFGRPGLGREAEADFRKAVELYDELAARFPSVPEYPARAALNRSNEACCMVTDGRLVEAESVFRQVLGFWERMSAGDPSIGKYRSKIALTLGNLGEVLEKTSRKPEAEQALRRAADLRSVLTQETPTEAWQFIQLGNLLAELARLAADRGDMAAVRRLEEQALSSKRAGLALAPRNADSVESTSTTHSALIETLIRLREHEDAARAVSELISFSSDSAPQCFRAGSFLARCVPLPAADARLTDARRIELAKTYADRAVELLREAKKMGHQDIEALKSDHNFDSIRSRADFQGLLAGSVATESKRSP